MDAALKKRFHAMIDTADYTNASIVRLIAHDDAGTVLFIAVIALHEEAAALDQFLDGRS